MKTLRINVTELDFEYLVKVKYTVNVFFNFLFSCTDMTFTVEWSLNYLN